MSTAQVTKVERLLLHSVSWDTYTQLLKAFAEHPRVRMTYDRGELELMSPVAEHEHDARFVERLIVILTEELNLTLMTGGGTTLRRRRRRRGLEPDCCYWIANEPLMRGKRRLDLRIDPPPDLALEVDVTRSSLNRMGIYARLGVPEVWRFDAPTFTFHILSGGRYTESDQSQNFPGLKATDLPPFLALRTQLDDNAVARQFRAWVQQRIAAGWQ